MAPWGPLDSGLMRMMMMMMKVFTLLILNRHNFKRTFGAPRCSKVLHPGFDLGFDPGFDRELDPGA